MLICQSAVLYFSVIVPYCLARVRFCSVHLWDCIVLTICGIELSIYGSDLKCPSMVLRWFGHLSKYGVVLLKYVCYCIVNKWDNVVLHINGVVGMVHLWYCILLPMYATIQL